MPKAHRHDDRDALLLVVSDIAPPTTLRRFERWVFPDFGIKQVDWEIFRDLVQERLQSVIQDLDTRFTSFERPDEHEEQALSVGVGMYLYKDGDDDSRLFNQNSVKSG